jgi:hypothetical protein
VTPLLDQKRNAQWPSVPPTLEGLELIELEGSIRWKRSSEVQVEPAEVAGDLPSLELGATEREAEIARALSEPET